MNVTTTVSVNERNYRAAVDEAFQEFRSAVSHARQTVWDDDAEFEARVADLKVKYTERVVALRTTFGITPTGYTEPQLSSPSAAYKPTHGGYPSN